MTTKPARPDKIQALPPQRSLLACAGQLLESNPRNVRQTADVGKRVHMFLFPYGTSLREPPRSTINGVTSAPFTKLSPCTPFNRASYSEHQWRENNSSIWGVSSGKHNILCLLYQRWAAPR